MAVLSCSSADVDMVTAYASDAQDAVLPFVVLLQGRAVDAVTPRAPSEARVPRMGDGRLPGCAFQRGTVTFAFAQGIVRIDDAEYDGAATGFTRIVLVDTDQPANSATCFSIPGIPIPAAARTRPRPNGVLARCWTAVMDRLPPYREDDWWQQPVLQHQTVQAFRGAGRSGPR